MSVMKYKDENNKWVEMPIIKGADGNPGVWTGSETPPEGYTVWVDPNDTEYSSVYAVGDTVITETNTNPSSRLGGTWELFDKGFKDQHGDIPITDSIYSSGSVGCVWDGKSINMRFSIKTIEEITSTNITIATFTPSDFGVNRFMYVKRIVGAYNYTNTVVGSTLHEDGKLEIYKNDSAIAADVKMTFSYIHTSVMDEMLDDFCDKFYWKKVN